VRTFTPNVIEPSFGIGRILYSLLEHSWWQRENDKARGVLSLNALVAPTKCLIVTISQDPELRAMIYDICKPFHPICPAIGLRTARKLRKLGVASRVDDSSSTIGKKYSRNDELGESRGSIRWSMSEGLLG
jgi:glycyl-tRNA synthetase